jgi:hypothetical protein
MDSQKVDVLAALADLQRWARTAGEDHIIERTRAAVAELIAAATDMCSSLNPEWAADNVSPETAAETLRAALAACGGAS